MGPNQTVLLSVSYFATQATKNFILAENPSQIQYWEIIPLLLFLILICDISFSH